MEGRYAICFDSPPMWTIYGGGARVQTHEEPISGALTRENAIKC